MNFLASAPLCTRYKIRILGDTKVGKTCIGNRYLKDEFTEKYSPTVDVDYNVKKLKFYKYILYDRTGEIKNMNDDLINFKNVDCFLLVYDVTLRKSFNNLSKWLELIKEEKKMSFLLWWEIKSI